MHGMRPERASWCPKHVVLVLLAVLAIPRAADADLLRPSAPRAYPDVAADINGSISYEYDEQAGGGTFTFANTPFLLATGGTTDEEFGIIPTSDGGTRSQSLSVALDVNGAIVPSSSNSFEVVGQVNVAGQTFDGVLLEGVPTEFGWADLDQVGVATSDIFDLAIDLTGGLLAPAFGPDAYIRLVGELDSTFDGSFAADFSAEKATSNTRGYNAPDPNPIPEPSVALIFLVVSAGGLAYRRRRRVLASS